MTRYATWLGLTFGLPLALLGFVGAKACAQNPYAVPIPTYTSPYFGYSSDPYGYGSLLNGLSSVINSQGQFLISKEQANLLKQQVASAKIDTRRKHLEQWLWEREHLPTWQDDRELVKKEELRRARNDPPITEIWSAYALNVLLADSIKIQSPGLQANAPALDPEMLDKINVSTGKHSANIGLIKGGKVFWPFLFRHKEFAEDRERLDELIKNTIEETKGNQVDSDAIFEMKERVEGLSRRLTRIVKAPSAGFPLTPTMAIDARSFLKQLNESVNVLMQPDAAQYLNGHYKVKGKDVAEMVKHMAENGLQFAPATPGTEAAYKALHTALSTYSGSAGTQINSKDNR